MNVLRNIMNIYTAYDVYLYKFMSETKYCLTHGKKNE